MDIVTCKSCGHGVGMDDFIVAQCPVCDSFMDLDRLQLKVNPNLNKIIRVKIVDEGKQWRI